ncbi:MAG TPA: nucleoside deaminase [Puia sp.]|jgi:tRNA(Arg) A34 adenosine deaminase TadA
MNAHSLYLTRCLELARIAAAQGDSPVGSIVVKDGKILGEAWEDAKKTRDPTRHAEALAIGDAIKKHGSCEGATLYSNIEPCLLCAYVIRHHRIRAVVFNRYSGELGGYKGRINLLEADLSSWGKAPEVIVVPETPNTGSI